MAKLSRMPESFGVPGTNPPPFALPLRLIFNVDFQTILFAAFFICFSTFIISRSDRDQVICVFEYCVLREEGKKLTLRKVTLSIRTEYLGLGFLFFLCHKSCSNTSIQLISNSNNRILLFVRVNFKQEKLKLNHKRSVQTVC